MKERESMKLKDSAKNAKTYGPPADSMALTCSTCNQQSGAPRPLGPKEIDGLLVPPGTACSLLTDHLITG